MVSTRQLNTSWQAASGRRARKSAIHPVAMSLALGARAGLATRHWLPGQRGTVGHPLARWMCSLPSAGLSVPRRRPPQFNVGVVVVPQQTVYVVERFGRFNRLMSPGLQLIIPLVERITYAHSLKEEAIGIPNQQAITRDNVTISIDGVLYVKVSGGERNSATTGGRPRD